VAVGAAVAGAVVGQDDGLDAGLEQIDGAFEHAVVGGDAREVHGGDAVAFQRLKQIGGDAGVGGLVDDGRAGPGRERQPGVVRARREPAPAHEPAVERPFRVEEPGHPQALEIVLQALNLCRDVPGRIL